MRLIDADKLKADFIGNRYGVQAIEYVIDQQPTVEVVRCKDCKYGDPNGYGCKCYHYKLYETHEMSPNDFCSRAERRIDENC